MKLQVTKKYLTVPVNTERPTVKLLMRDINGKLLFDLDCSPDAKEPNFTAYIDVERFRGMILELSTQPEIELSVEETDDFVDDSVYAEDMRPRIHFAVKNGWNNDPNGLVYRGGEYHMFYQYNPCSPKWGNMHWGHAVSRDMLHWTELDCALFPDENGTVYSGSAMIDERNASGLKNGENAPLLVFYTAAGGRNLLSGDAKYTQRLAYMNEEGKLVKYGNFPIIPNISGGNRDPKVVWCEEIGAYILILYIGKGRFALFSSDDLLSWTEIQRLWLEGDRECPDIYPISCGSERLWVFCAANDIYVLGRFENGLFTAITEPTRLSYSPMNYAGQSFSGMKDGRIVRIYWQRAAVVGNSRITQQMSIPVEMRLNRSDDGYFLTALPIRELSSLRSDKLLGKTSDIGNCISFELGANAADLELEAEYDADVCITLDVFGSEISLDMRQNEVIYRDMRMPLSYEKKLARLRLVVDRCTVELYADGGRYLLAANLICDPSKPYISLASDKAIPPSKLDVYRLDTVYPKL